MNFEDEHYVRIYTRDTKTWKRWGWEARCVFMALWRKLDKAGVLEDVEDPVDDVALMTELPVEVVAIGLPKLVESGTVKVVDGYLIGVNYIEGQTSKKSDRVRAQESRERRRRKALLSQIVTDGHENDGSVTPCDESERAVTGRDSVTDCDGADTNRDRQSQIVTERHDNPGARHSTQCNAVQSIDPPYPPRSDRGLGIGQPRDRQDVQELHEAWKRSTGLVNHSIRNSRGANDASTLAEAIDEHKLPKCLLVARYAKRDGMVSGRDDEGRKHESIGYIFGNPTAFARILRDAEKSERASTSNSPLANIRKAEAL